MGDASSVQEVDYCKAGRSCDPPVFTLSCLASCLPTWLAVAMGGADSRVQLHYAKVRAVFAACETLDPTDLHSPFRLTRAAKRGDEPEVRRLLERGEKWDEWVSTGGSNALQFAVSATVSGQPPRPIGVDVLAQDDIGWPALFRAAAGGNVAVMQLLVDAGADVTAVNDEGLTALHTAAEGAPFLDDPDNVDAVRWLLDRGADIHAVSRVCLYPHIDRRPTLLETPLHAAARGHNLGVVQLLLARGATTGAVPGSAMSVLHTVTMCPGEEARRHQIVCALLGAGADPKAQTFNGSTALHFAARNGYPGIVRELLRVGADPNAGLFRCSSSAGILAGVGRFLSLVDLGRPSPEVRGTGIADGDTPLLTAVKSWCHETAFRVDKRNLSSVVEALVAAGGDPLDEHAARRKAAASPFGEAIGEAIVRGLARRASIKVMDRDPFPPTRFRHEEWVRTRDHLYFGALRTTADRKAAVAHEVAKAMNILQEDYGTRLTTVGIQGAVIAELFAVGCAGFMGEHHTARSPKTLDGCIQHLLAAGAISERLADDLHTLRRHGNSARHPHADDMRPEHKPAVAKAAFSVALAIASQLPPAVLTGRPPRNSRRREFPNLIEL